MNKDINFGNGEHKDWHIFSIIGRMDIVTAPEVEKAGVDVLQSNDKIAVDMSAIEYISSAGLRVLLRLTKKAKRANKPFVFFGAGSMIKEVLEASGMDMLITIYQTQDDLP